MRREEITRHNRRPSIGNNERSGGKRNHKYAPWLDCTVSSSRLRGLKQRRVTRLLNEVLITRALKNAAAPAVNRRIDESIALMALVYLPSLLLPFFPFVSFSRARARSSIFGRKNPSTTAGGAAERGKTIGKAPGADSRSSLVDLISHVRYGYSIRTFVRAHTAAALCAYPPPLPLRRPCPSPPLVVAPFAVHTTPPRLPAHLSLSLSPPSLSLRLKKVSSLFCINITSKSESSHGVTVAKFRREVGQHLHPRYR